MALEDNERTRTDRYLHWEKMRYKSRPAGVSAEERWVAIKMKRMAQRQSIPLLDTGGRKFGFSLTGGMFEKLHAIDLRCGGTVEGPEPITNPDTRDRYYVSSLMAEATTSSQLEGAVVTRSEAKAMLRTGRKPVGEGERMILNNFLTMREISKWKDRELTVELIKEVHAMITHGTLDKEEQEGEFRLESDDVRVEDFETGDVMHTPPPATELPERLAKLCDFANDAKMEGFLHPVLRSIILHFWIAYDHPFVDGNGRTARALFYWSMLKHRFWLFEFISISEQILDAPAKYYRAFLYTETDENDLNYFLIHQLDVIEKAIAKLHDYIQRKSQELQEMKRLLGGFTDFNHRQVALLRYALERPSVLFTVASHENSHGITKQTARTDLDRLHERGLLEKSKRGKSFAYTPIAGLREKVMELR